MDLLTKFVRAIQQFKPADWEKLMLGLAEGNRQLVAEMFGFTISEADIAFKNILSLSKNVLD